MSDHGSQRRSRRGHGSPDQDTKHERRDRRESRRWRTQGSTANSGARMARFPIAAATAATDDSRRLDSPHGDVCADDYSVLQAETSPRMSHEPHRQTSELPSPPTSGGLGELYDQWLARQPSAVEKPAYTITTGILQRPTDDSEDEMSSADDWGNDIDESMAATGDAKTSGEHTNRAEPEDIGGDNSQTTSIECKVSPLQVLENTFISVIRVLTTEAMKQTIPVPTTRSSILQRKSALKIMHMSSLFFPI
ncbi:unnamed protein product [Phytophthora lilii]|uniref:Unnamed protein product n=1 Tax=Phytophthora lilii TaxID=2077276 RepID=A0A9W7CRD1_9STRA|nr:unnamed protein product [Phytophthora lilii]